MNKNLTEIIFIIDKSGSMLGLTDDTIGGFNSVLESQREGVDGEAVVTTVLFNGTVTKLHDRVDVREVEPMTKKQYIASGGTALLDAIGQTIDEVQKRIDNTPEDERPGNVICAITTDGQENASRTYTKDRVKKMIEHQTKGHGWDFLFLGANMDAVSEAASIGINNSVTYFQDGIGTRGVYTAMSMAATSKRVTGAIDDLWCADVQAYNAQKVAEDACIPAADLVIRS